MNKIQVEGIKNKEKNIEIFEDTIVLINNSNNKIIFHIKKNANVFFDIDNSNLKIEFEIEDDSSINIFTLNSSLEVDLNFRNSNTFVNYAYSTINEDDNRYKININHLNKNITSKIVNHGINLKSNNLSFEVNTIVPKSSTNIKTTQDSKIILSSDKTGVIKPNLLVDNDDIEANHSAYIGKFKDEELFYLETRGIDKDKAISLLAKSFLIGSMNNISFREKDIILEKIKRYWR